MVLISQGFSLICAKQLLFINFCSAKWPKSLQVKNLALALDEKWAETKKTKNPIYNLRYS